MSLFKLLAFLHSWSIYERIVNWQDEEEMIDSVRCSLCGLFGCKKHNALQPPHGSRQDNFSIIPPSLPMGEPVGSEALSGVVIEQIKNAKMEKVENKSVVETKVVGTKSTSDFVHCNLCRARVAIQYLDKHLKVHTHNFNPADKKALPTQNASTSIVVREQPANTNRTPNYTTTTYSPPKEKPGTPHLSPIETYKFRKLEEACAASSMSQNGRYSDFTVILWGAEKPAAYSNVYAGGHSTYAAKEWDRCCIHIVYDNVEDYFTMSCKILRRGQYTAYDSEDSIPDRICYQEELLGEIKRALLFFRLSPKTAYKQFRKLFKQDIVIDYDDDGNALIAQTKNCDALNDRLKKSSTYDHRHAAYDYGC